MGINIRKLKKEISIWWNGKLYVNNPDDYMYYIGIQVRHPTAIIARKTISYIKREYKFIIYSVIAIIGIIMEFASL